MSEANTPDGMVDALDAAAECLGFSSAQVMVVAPARQPAVFVMETLSERMLRFDRAVIAGSDLTSAYDYDLGSPIQDPVLRRLRDSPLPVVWDGDTYIDAGLGAVRDWWIENDRGNGVSVRISLPIQELSRPLEVVVSVQCRDRIRPEDWTRAAADTTLLAMHAAVGSDKVLAPLLLSSRHAKSPLTPAMRQYLAWAELGKTAGETADIVGRKYSTVKNVLAQAMERLGCSNKVDAVRLARCNGWL